MDLDFALCYYDASLTIHLFQVKAIAENVDKAVRELPDANLVGCLVTFLTTRFVNVFSCSNFD